MKPSDARVALWAEVPGELDEVGRVLRALGFRAQAVESLEDLQAVLDTGLAELAVVRLSACCRETLEWLQGEEAARLAHRPVATGVPLLVVVDAWDKDLYLEALRGGASDALVLPLDARELLRIVTQALNQRALAHSS